MSKNININGEKYFDVSKIKVKDANTEALHTYFDTTDGDIKSNDIPVGKVGYGKDGKVIGTHIQPNGEIEGGINFYDQYGAWLTSYRLEDLPLSALPEIPALDGAGADQYEFAWTMTLEEVNALTEEADIGVDVTAKEGAKTYFIPHKGGFTGVAQMFVITTTTDASFLVDWGDGTTTSFTASANTTQYTAHTFGAKSHNPIVVEKTSGEAVCFSQMTGISANIKEIRFGVDFTELQSLGLYSSIEKFLFHNKNYLKWNGGGNFFGSYVLKSLNIPKSDNHIFSPSSGGYCLAKDCYSLENIFFHEGVKSSSGFIASGCPMLKSIVLPNSLKEITYSKIADSCYGLKKIRLPKTKITMADNADIATTCYALEKIENLSSLSCNSLSSCMSKCYSLREFVIPEGTTTLGAGCFENCYGIKSLEIPESVVSIGTNFLRYARSLRQIKMKSATPPTMNTNMNSTYWVKLGLLTIYVPKGSIEAYATATNWSAVAECFVEY